MFAKVLVASGKCARQMTVLAVGAAATAVATAASASPTRYERTLRNCARALSDFAGCSEPGAAINWDEERFREWARSHRAEASKQAGRFVARLLRDKAANASVGYTARLHVAAWKAYGVAVEQSVLDELGRLTRERWRPATVSRLSALGARKSDQFDLLEQNWEKLVSHLGDTAGEQFAEHCRAAQSSQPTSIACELAYLSRKPVGELEQALLRTRAFCFRDSHACSISFSGEHTLRVRRRRRAPVGRCATAVGIRVAGVRLRSGQVRCSSAVRGGR